MEEKKPGKKWLSAFQGFRKALERLDKESRHGAVEIRQEIERFGHELDKKLKTQVHERQERSGILEEVEKFEAYLRRLHDGLSDSMKPPVKPVVRVRTRGKTRP